MLKVLRWNAAGEPCPQPKCLFVMAPHSSWWDFTNNFALLLASGLHASWFIANKYTKGLIGPCLAFFGAVPVDRNQRTDMVTQMASQFIYHEKFLLVIFPEGTRKPVPTWKSGFWYIAKQAQVPIQLVAVDYQKRCTVFGPLYYLSDDMEADIQNMRAFFTAEMAKHPHKACYTASP